MQGMSTITKYYRDGNLELEEARVSTWTESETLILIKEFGNFQVYNGFFLSQFIISPYALINLVVIL